MLQAIESADAAVLLFVQDHVRCAFLDVIMKAASFLGNGGLLWIVLAVVLLLFSRTRRDGLDMVLCMAVPWLMTEGLVKNLVGRTRPYLALEGLVPIVEPLRSWSFPSGHTCSAFAAATALALAFRGKGGGWAFLPAALIAVSRVYVGVHYPTDVLAGAAIGALLSWAVFRLSRRIVKQTPAFPGDKGRRNVVH
jgi:membrane-associated phospholipid phosphatase